MYKSITIDAAVPEKTAAPVKIGAKGTIGSLIMQEIEYFSRPEVRCIDNSRKAQSHSSATIVSCSSHSRPMSISVINEKKKKKERTRLLPSMCSMVEVADNRRPTVISGFGYRNLKFDENQQV